MKQIEFLQKLKELGKCYYTVSEIQTVLGQSRLATKVTINRFIKTGTLERLGRNVYVPALESYNLEEIATVLYAPCYISFESALAKYGILSQIPHTLTCATLRKSRKIRLGGQEVEYRRLKKELFFGYRFLDKMAIAEPEKSLLDQLYFVSLGKAILNLEDLDFSKLSRKKFLKFASVFPKSVQKRAKSLEFRFKLPWQGF